MSSELVPQPIFYGLDLVDAITGGPLVGSSQIRTTAIGSLPPFRAERSRWVFSNLPGPVPPALPTTFVITAHFYVGQTLTTGTFPGLPNPTGTQPGYLATITMTPRTGYPFSPTLTRVIGLVRLAAAVDPTSPPVPNAIVQLTPVHYDATTGTTTSETPIAVTTTDDGQFTTWFLPILTDTPAIANQITSVSATATVNGVVRSGTISTTISLSQNGLTYAPTITLS